MHGMKYHLGTKNTSANCLSHLHSSTCNETEVGAKIANLPAGDLKPFLNIATLADNMQLLDRLAKSCQHPIPAFLSAREAAN